MRILADTSIWIDHFQRNNEQLGVLLHDEAVLMHPFVFGELLLGGIAAQNRLAELLGDLPCVTRAEEAEVFRLIELHQLQGKGIGYVDTHLLTAARITGETHLWTLDRRLDAVARQLGVAATLNH